jgi:hypothetical protein
MSTCGGLRAELPAKRLESEFRAKVVGAFDKMIKSMSDAESQDAA